MLSISAEITNSPVWKRPGVSCALGLVALSLVACGELEPMVEPEVVDLQLTVETLKTQIREAQRTMTELRTELEAQRQELAEAHVAKAQLEGRVREAERRVAEAQHVIDLQREELIAARTERERITKSSLQLQGQIKHLQKHVARSHPFPEYGKNVAPASRDGSSGKMQKASTARFSSESTIDVPNTMTAAAYTEIAGSDFSAAEHQIQGRAVRAVTVKSGDTLFSLARTHRVGLNRLKSLNGLTDDLIEVGQTIWVPANRSAGSAPSGSAGTSP